MKNILLYFKDKVIRNKDSARVELGPLKMSLKKIMAYDHPHEFSIFIPRVEIREKVNWLFYRKTREIIYNSVTIVDAPRAPLHDNENGESSPPEFFKEKNFTNSED
ncbi:MAG: hypothetical protein ACOWWO_09135 [Peptococcaceae bacterium]